MTNAGLGTDGRATRDDLVERVALMEAMVAEGRRTTTRFGWMSVMWGLLYIAAVLWQMFLPLRNLAWPVCVAAGVVTMLAARSRRMRMAPGETLRSRSIQAIWKGTSVAITLFVIAAVVSHHVKEPTYVAAIMFLIGLAQGISAQILRWVAQGLSAAIWWACGIAMFFFTTQMETLGLFLTATFFGMVLFGLYTMMLERRRGAAPVQQHA